MPQSYDQLKAMEVEQIEKKGRLTVELAKIRTQVEEIKYTSERQLAQYDTLDHFGSTVLKKFARALIPSAHRYTPCKQSFWGYIGITLSIVRPYFL